MSGDGNLFFASIGVNPGKSTTICDVAGLDSGIVIVNSCELYYQKPFVKTETPYLQFWSI